MRPQLSLFSLTSSIAPYRGLPFAVSRVDFPDRFFFKLFTEAFFSILSSFAATSFSFCYVPCGFPSIGKSASGGMVVSFGIVPLCPITFWESPFPRLQIVAPTLSLGEPGDFKRGFPEFLSVVLSEHLLPPPPLIRLGTGVIVPYFSSFERYPGSPQLPQPTR